MSLAANGKIGAASSPVELTIGLRESSDSRDGVRIQACSERESVHIWYLCLASAGRSPILLGLNASA